MPQPGTIAEFKTRIRGRGLPRWWVVIRVFPSRRAMHSYERREYGSSSRHYRAIFIGARFGDKEAKKRRYLGEILYCIKDLTIELVAHECLHAAMAWWRVCNRMGVEDNITLILDEETFVTALGRLANSVEAEVAKLRPVPDVE